MHGILKRKTTAAKNSILKLNLYKKPGSDESTLEQELIATRIYIIVFPSVFLLVILTIALYPRTINTTEYDISSTQFEVLQRAYPMNLKCPCTNIGTTYGKFVDVHVNFHQVCESHFITKTWIDTIFNQRSNNSTAIDDFRHTLGFFWFVISKLCIISNQTFSQAISRFDNYQILSPNALSRTILENQAQNDLNQQISSLQSTLPYNLFALKGIITGNYFVSAMGTNFYISQIHSTDPAQIRLKMKSRSIGNCTCLNSNGCPHQATVKDMNGLQQTIPGMIVDCYMVDSTLASSLECYYNRTCVSLLHNLLGNNIDLLDDKMNRYWTKDVTLLEIFNLLMIDQLKLDIRFDKFYHECSPKLCSYSYNKRFDFVFVIATSIGVFKPLSLLILQIAKIVSKLIVRRKRRRQIRQKEKDNSNQLLKIRTRLFNSFFKTLREMNIFQNVGDNIHDLKQQRMMTRVFIIFLIISVIGAAIFCFVTSEEQIVTIYRPSESQYHKLYNIYTNNLVCPCSKVSFSYETLINFTFISHQICSSDLVSDEWLTFIRSFDPLNVPIWTETSFSRDFRVFGIVYFQFLRVFCSLSELIINDAKNSFKENQFLSFNLVSKNVFEQQLDGIVINFINSTQNNFIRILLNIDFVQQVGQFLSGTNLDANGRIENGSVKFTGNEYRRLMTITNTSISTTEGCTCTTLLSSCSIGVLVYTNGVGLLNYHRHFREFILQCLSANTFYFSRTDWWYDQAYMDDIKDTYRIIMNANETPNLQALKNSTPTRFLGEIALVLVENMFIESIDNQSLLFDEYFQECEPKSCSYTMIAKRNVWVALILLTSVSSGINRSLRLIIPIGGNIIFFLYRKLRTLKTIRGRSHKEFSFSIPTVVKSLIVSIKNYNVFQNERIHADDVRFQLLYTRIYLLLMVACLALIIIYSSVIEHIYYETIASPSIDDYERLIKVYPDSVTCPCSRVSILYKDIIIENGDVHFHELCTSEVLLRAFQAGSYLEWNDVAFGQEFKTWSALFSQGVDLLCDSVKRYVAYSTERFFSSIMYAYQVVPQYRFEQDMNIILSNFRVTLPIGFGQSIDLSRVLIQGNALMTAFNSDWTLFMRNGSFVGSEPKSYKYESENKSCACYMENSCTMPVTLINESSSKPLVVNSPKGIVFGCNLFESVLSSSVMCLYSADCVTEYRTLVGHYGSIDEWNSWGQQMLFNQTSLSFKMNDTIETLARQLFIESWLMNVSYEKFFHACAPTYCTGQLFYRFNMAEICTNLLSIYGGLSGVLLFSIPKIVRMITAIYRFISGRINFRQNRLN